jgi:hypothetical protein
MLHEHARNKAALPRSGYLFSQLSYTQFRSPLIQPSLYAVVTPARFSKDPEKSGLLIKHESRGTKLTLMSL